MTKTVGILAYGSLISDPRSEIEEVCTRIIDDVQTPFPVEFARSSSGRGGAPTLVPYGSDGCVRARVIVVNTTVEDAAHRLYRREIDRVGTGRLYEHSEDPGTNTVVVDRLEDQFELDVVLYTRIGANIEDLSAERLAELAIASVAKAKDGRDGITYLMNALSAGITTPLTPSYEAEILRQTGAADLKAALAAARTMG